MTPTKRFLFLLLFTGIGIAFGIGFGIAFYFIRKKKDEEITISGSINEIIAPSISFWVTIGILLILKCEYGIPLKLFIMSAIILASFLATISSKNVLLFIIGIGIVVLELGLESFIRRIIEWINCKAKKMKTENIPEKNAPTESAPPLDNSTQPKVLNNNYYKLYPNAPQPSAPPNLNKE